MFKRLNDERGYALILSLFAIVFISLLGLGLMGSTISTAKQTNQTDTFYRTTHIAEMGIQYTEESVKSYVNSGTVPFTGTSESQVKDYIEAMFESIRINSSNVVIDNEFPGRQYELQEDINIEVMMDEGVAEVNFDVIGRDSNQEKTLSATISLKGFARSGDGGSDNDEMDWDELFPEDPPDGWEKETEIDLFKGDETINNNLWVETDVMLKKTDITVKGDCVINGSLLSDTGNDSTLTVCGNAKFNEEVNDSKDNTGFKGHINIGNHALFQEKFNLHHKSYLSGGSTYLKNGAQIDNGVNSFRVGQNLEIDANNPAAYYNFGMNNSMQIKGDLIIHNVDSEANTLPISFKRSIHVGGEVKIYYKDGTLVPEYDLDKFGLIISPNTGANIQYHFDFGTDLDSIFEPNCKSSPTDSGDNDEPDPSEPIIPEVDIVNVDY
jgi:hypothetical protein